MPGWLVRRDGIELALNVTGSIEANKGESLAQRARAGVGVVRIGTFAVQGDLASGRPVPLLEDYDTQDRDPLHILCVGGSTMPARDQPLVDFLVERLVATRI